MVYHQLLFASIPSWAMALPSDPEAHFIHTILRKAWTEGCQWHIQKVPCIFFAGYSSAFFIKY